MTNDNADNGADAPADNNLKTKKLPEAAKRALAEAAERRKQADENAQEAKKEYGGRGGADPARFGDWEIDGRAIDF